MAHIILCTKASDVYNKVVMARFDWQYFVNGHFPSICHFAEWKHVYATCRGRSLERAKWTVTTEH